MPNAIKYSITIPSGSLKKGNVALGLDITGPTSVTGWYAGITPSSNYIVYEVSASSFPKIYAPSNDNELIALAIQEGATGANTASTASVLSWIATQPNLMAVNRDYENIVTDGLILNLDAGFTPSYPTTASTWYDISGNNKNGTLINGPLYDSADEGSIVFDGVDDLCTFPVNTFNSGSPQEGTYYFRINYPPYPSVQNQLFNESGGSFNVGIVYYRNPATPANRYFFVNYYNNGVTNTANVLGFIDNLPAGIWADVAFTFDSSGKWATYRNGTLANSGTAANFVSWTRTGTGTPQIKCSSPDGAGKQQLFYYYNRALSASEILQIFNATKDRIGL